MRLSQYNKTLHSKSFMSFLDLDPSLEEILDNDETEREIRLNNSRLQDLITDADVSYLLSLLTKEPGVDSSECRAFKYPFLAHLFFLPNCRLILGKVLSKREHVMALLSFLEGPDYLNDTLSGYFATVFMSLYNESPQKMLGVVYENGFHTKLLEIVKSSQNSHLADVLYVCVSAPNSPQDFFESRIDLLSVLLPYIHSRSIKDIVVRLVTDSLTTSSYQSLMEYLLLEVNLHEIVKSLHEVVPNACEVLEALLNAVGGHEGLINALTDNMDFLASVLSKEQNNRLGPQRLAVLKLLRTGIEYADEYLAEALCDSKVLEIATALFERFPWNSFLHVVYYEVVENSLNNPMLKMHLLEKCGLIAMLKRNRPVINVKSREFRKGSMGSLFKIARLLIVLSQTDAYLSAQLRSEEWESFRHSLDLQIRIESNILGKGRCYTSKFNDNTYWKIRPSCQELEDLE